MGLTTAWRKSGLLKNTSKKFLIIYCHRAMETPLASLSLPHRQPDMFPLPSRKYLPRLWVCQGTTKQNAMHPLSPWLWGCIFLAHWESSLLVCSSVLDCADQGSLTTDASFRHSNLVPWICIYHSWFSTLSEFSTALPGVWTTRH